MTDEGDVFRRAADSISAKEDMFRFNPGKQEKAVPDYNPYTIRQCKNCPIASGDTTSQLARFVPSNEVCQACALIRQCAGDKTKKATAIEKMHYLHEMAPLLKKKVLLATDGKDINVGFTKYGNKHLYSDTHGRSKVLTKDDLKTLDKTMTGAKYIDKADLTHPRQDNIEKFFYYEADLHGGKIRLNVAKKVRKQKGGYMQETYFLYSINDIKKSTSGGG
ncbi:MAG: hypothetical protein LUC26_01455 [Prevotella sp.]|nr:hypothetical protein [Prevotella sp.]